MSGHSAIYAGWVRHRRQSPVPHAFRNRLFMMYLDLDELDEVFRGRWLWSAGRPAPAWFREADHLGAPGVPLRISVARLVESETGRPPAGPIRLLTHLRYFGCCMNPVSFFYCFDEADRGVETIVAEVHNTPWAERHCYVLGAALDTSRDEGRGRRHRYRFDKVFHVSPFMPMDLGYDWRFTTPDDHLAVQMVNLEGDRPIFDATLALRRRPIDGRQLARVLLAYPLMTARVLAAIYWQALLLRLKRCPFHPHPKHLAAEGGR